MREARPVRLNHCLVLAVAWMLAVQLACLLAWGEGWLGRHVALTHWLLVGVLPPALALWQQERRG